MFRRHMKTKGLEPIVAAVLLIVVAVIGAVLVYLWFSGYVTRATSQAEQLAASEKIKIEGASIDTNAGNVVAYVRNLGNSSITVDTVYVLHPETLNVLCNSDANTTVGSGTVQSVTATCSGLTAGQSYIVKVVTTRGTEAAITVVAS